MKKIFWLILTLMAFGCAGVEKGVKKEETIPLVTPAEIKQEVLAKKEPIVIRQEIIPLPQIIPLPLGRSESSKPEKPIPKGVSRADEVKETGTETKQASVTHSVKKGECLWRIAEKHYHDGFLYKAIAQTNQIQSPYTIYPGQALIIPRLHLVKKGECLSKIAEEYYHKDTLYGMIARVNHIPSPYIIYPDQILVIPAKNAIPSRTEAKVLPKLRQQIGKKPYQVTWQEAIDEFNLPIPVKEQVKKNVRKDKFQWFETGLTSEQKLSQLIFGDGEIWDDALCYWSSYQGYKVKDYGTDQYRVIRLSECGSWAWWKEEPRGPPKDLSLPKALAAPKEFATLKEVPTKKKEASFPWLMASFWIVAISVIAAAVIVPWRARKKRR